MIELNLGECMIELNLNSIIDIPQDLMYDRIKSWGMYDIH